MWGLAWLAGSVVVAVVGGRWLAVCRELDDAHAALWRAARTERLGGVNARLLADLHATHQRMPVGRTSNVDHCATQLREAFDGLGVDLSDARVVDALAAFIDAVDMLADAHGQRGESGVACVVPQDAWFEVVAAHAAVAAGRQVVLSAARGEIVREVAS